MPLEAKNLTKEYIRGNKVFKAVDSAELQISPGDFLCIIGRSGSGKSTLLNMLAGLLTPTSGSVELDGVNITAWGDKALSLYRNEKIGYIPQGQSTLSSLSVLDNVRVSLHLFNRKGDSSALAEALLQKVGIAHLAGGYPKHLSGGELKRVAIARALINHPDYIIADEPTGDLDTQTTAEIMRLFQDISESGTGVLIVTHELDVLTYGNRTFSMDAGVLSVHS